MYKQHIFRYICLQLYTSISIYYHSISFANEGQTVGNLFTPVTHTGMSHDKIFLLEIFLPQLHTQECLMIKYFYL